MKTPAEHHVVAIRTPRAMADALETALADRFGAPVVQLQKPADRWVWLEVYFSAAALARRAMRALSQIPEVGTAAPRVARVEDWQRSWRKHFKKQPIGDNLLICPVWEKPGAAGRGRKIVWIDPGVSFGTGDHFTTRFCLEALSRLVPATRPASVLDAGTGSAILAIAAAKLGCRQVTAFDHDPQAVEQARANARRNRVAPHIRFSRLDLNEGMPRGAFDLVVANIYSGLLITHAAGLARLTRRHLAVSGIRERELDLVADAYMRQGLREVMRDGDGEWGGLLFERASTASRGTST